MTDPSYRIGFVLGQHFRLLLRGIVVGYALGYAIPFVASGRANAWQLTAAWIAIGAGISVAAETIASMRLLLRAHREPSARPSPRPSARPRP